MESRTIKVSNVKENEYGISIGYKEDDQPWENYYVNDESLFDYFKKGATVVVEYEKTKAGNKVIKGVSKATAQQAAAVGGESGEGRSESIEKQVLCKVAGELYAAAIPTSGLPTAAEVAAFVNTMHAEVFATPKAEQLFEEEL